MVSEEVEAAIVVLIDDHRLREKEEFPDHAKEGHAPEEDPEKEQVFEGDLQ